MRYNLLVNIDVPDLDAGIDFYEKGLEFAFRRRLFDGLVAEMVCDQARVFLISQAAATSAVPNTRITRDYADHWTPIHLDLVVDDLPAAIARAVAAGAAAPVAIGHHAWGDLAPMRDPFGHGFCLIAFRGSGYDGVASP